MTPCGRTNPFDLIIFDEQRVVFVRVKRSVTHFTDPLEILYQYRRDAGRLHRVPLTAVTARELWVRTPRGKWQFFLIRHDSVSEVQRDGTVIPHVALPINIPEHVVQDTSPHRDTVETRCLTAYNPIFQVLLEGGIPTPPLPGSFRASFGEKRCFGSYQVAQNGKFRYTILK